jgi:phosphatidylserine/phosphatidylglycerophosphate/cardiolipin synthase-like enzyme
MGRTFSLPSEALGAYLGYALLHYDEVAIVSPWVSDVQVSFPVNNREIESRQYLSEAIEVFGDETDLTVYLRSGQAHNNYIRSKLGKHATIELVDDLHAKTIVTADSAYVGSANVTHSGLSINRELCHIIENEYATIDDYVREELDLY